MEQPQFAAGSESRFSQFIQSLSDGKIALLTHTDLDGIAAGKIAAEVIKPDLLDFVDYKDLMPSLIEKLKQEKIETLVLTDLAMNEEFVAAAEKEFSLLIIDHHQFPRDFNSEKTVYLNAQELCAAYICYYLFSKIQNLERFDWLVACACIADWNYRKNQDFMNSVFKKYNDSFEFASDGLIRNSGFLWDLHWSITLAIIYFDKDPKKIFDYLNSITQAQQLSRYSLAVQREIDTAVEKFEKEKIQIKEGYFWENSPIFRITQIISGQISKKHWHETIIIATPRPQDGIYSLSLRHQDGARDMSKLVQQLVFGFENSSGGGHIMAAGGHVKLQDKEKLIKKIENL